MEVRRGRSESGDPLPMPPRGEVARRKTTDGSMGDRPTDVHPAAADILDQRGGFGALGSRPDYPEGAQYIDPSETNGDGPLSICYFRIIGGNPDSQMTYPRLRPIPRRLFGRRASTSGTARLPRRIRLARPPCRAKRSQRTQRPVIYGADAIGVLYQIERDGRRDS